MVTGQPGIGNWTSATENEWVNLAVIRDAGQTAFFVNGEQKGATVSQTPVYTANSGHLAVGSGATNVFTGDIDNIRMFTFTAGDDAVSALTVNQIAAVPEPSATVLLSLVSLVLLVRRKR